MSYVELLKLFDDKTKDIKDETICNYMIIQIHISLLQQLYALIDKDYGDVDISNWMLEKSIDSSQLSLDKRKIFENKKEVEKISRMIFVLQRCLIIKTKNLYSATEINKCIIPSILIQLGEYYKDKNGIRGVNYIIDSLKKE
jgi:hypothetical protein